MSKVGIVCDSTCDLGPSWLNDHDVVMVPLKIHFGESTYLDWLEITPDTFYDRLAHADVLPKTSQPSPADFSAVYHRLADEGCTDIVSIHITSALSGTVESALMAAKTFEVPVRVVNTLTAAVGEGLAVIAAVEARDAGGDADSVEAAALDVVNGGRTLFALDTLDYLVKGGRAGKAQGLAASMLRIKPVLTFSREGTIEPYKKVKGLKKAIAEIAAAIAEAGPGRIRVGVLHAQAPDIADELIAAIEATGCDYELAFTSTVGAVIGTYAGPRAIGAAYYRLP